MRSKTATCALAVGLSFALSGASLGRETLTYTYDSVGRVKSMTSSDGTGVNYTYDTAGNRVQVGVGGPPVAVNDAVTTPKNTAVTIYPRTNDSDPNGDTLTIVATTAPAHGSVVIQSSGTQLQYTPTTNYAGSDSFSYTISDGNGNSAMALITVTVQGPPVATTDTQTVQMNGTLTFNPLTNDSDPNGDSLTVTAKTNGAHGTVSFTSSSVTYTPTTSYTGTDSFTYTVSDGQGNTANGTVNVTVSAVNHVPDAVNDSKLTQRNATLVFDPRTNDTDSDGNTLTITGTSTPSHGTVSIVSGSTQLSYTPTTGYSGSDSFTYTISDGFGGTDTATVSMSVNGPPVTITDNKTTPVNTLLSFNPLSNDSDPDADTMTVTAKTDGSHGTVTYTSTSVSYTPATSYSGADSFTYTVSDGRGGATIGTVNVDVVSNQAPVANDDSADANAYYAGGAWVYPSVTFNPRTNDTDADSDTLTITAVTQPASGTVTFTGTQVTYTYNTHYHPTGVDSELVDSDSFTYTISDGHGHTATATVSINVIVW